MGFSNLVAWLIFNVSFQHHYKQLSEKSLCQFLTWQGEDLKKEEMGEAIILKISIKGGLLFKEIQYSLISLWESDLITTCVFFESKYLI